MFYCKKQFGQNFLIDQFIITSIVDHIKTNSNQILIEIGPGQGAITAPLLAKCQQLIAIEIDRELIAELNKKFYNAIQTNTLILINQDVLYFNFIELLNKYSKNKIKIIGNLPYNISTPLLFKLFALRTNQNLESMHFLLQKEVAERLIAQPKCHQYGKLSIMAQYHAKMNIVFYVKSSAFNPKPKVESAMVEFIPYKDLPITANNYEHFNQLVTTAFSQRRKILSNSLKNVCSKSDWELLNLNPTARAEQLSVHDFVKISNFLVEKHNA